MLDYDEFQREFTRLTEGHEKLLLFSGIWAITRFIQLPPRDFVERFLLYLQKLANEEGKTIVMPTFCWEFCRTGEFDYENSRSPQGVLTEQFRLLEGTSRTQHPINNYSVIGRGSQPLLDCKSNECSWSQSNLAGTLITENFFCVTIGLPWGNAFTPIHFAEYAVHVPYRYKKIFNGTYTRNGESTTTSETLFVQPFSTKIKWNPSRVRDVARNRNMVSEFSNSKIFVEGASTGNIVDVATELLEQDIYCFVDNEDEIRAWVETEKEAEIVGEGNR